ncbi:MAG: Filamentous hemagglutinin family outer membrane protein, partial [Microgenomates group bacterium GW2011_GWC1_37_8]
MLYNQKLFTIEQAAQALSVSTKTLRRWEQKGVISPIRTIGGHRRYSLETLKTLKLKSKRPSYEFPLKINLFEQEQKLPEIYVPEKQKYFAEQATNEALSYVYKYTPRIYKKIFFICLVTLLTSITLYEIVQKTKFAPVISLFENLKIESDESRLSDQVLPLKVLAASSMQNVQLRVFTQSIFEQDASFRATIDVDKDATIGGILILEGNTINSTDDILINPGGGGVSIGTETASIDLEGGDLFVSDELEVAGNLIGGQDADIAGDVSAGSLTINAETFTDLTGSGLTNSAGALTTTIGTSVESSEISDNTIQEVDLYVSNSPTNTYVLTYNSSSGGFTWAADQTGSGSLWTDGGAITYLTSTTDDLAIGGTTSSAPFFFDVSSGDLTITGILAVNGDQITSDGATLTINAGGNVDIQDTLNVNTLTTDTGGVTIVSGQDLTIGTIGLNDAGSGPTTSGAFLIGTFGEFDNSTSTNVQDVLDDLDAAIAGGATGDITAVGDILTGAAFTETAGDDGNSIWFEGTTNDTNELELTAADVSDDITTVTLPAITGTLASLAGTQIFTGAKTFNDFAVADTDISFSGASTTFTVTDSDSNLILSGMGTDANAVLYTDTGGVVTRVAETETGSLCLMSGTGASGVPSWTSCPGTGAGASKWQLAGEVISPFITSLDVAVGGTATTSASFQAFGIELTGTGGRVAKLTSDTIDTGVVLEATASAITTGTILKLGEGGNQNFSGNVIWADIDNTGGGGGAFSGDFLQFDDAGTTVFGVNYLGAIRASDLTLGLEDTSALITTSDAETLTIDPTGAGAIALGSVDITNITLDSVAFSIDATDPSNMTVTSNGAGDDLTIALAGNSDSSLILTSSGT